MIKAKSINLVFVNAPKENNLSLLFLFVHSQVREGGGSAMAEARPEPRCRIQLTPPDCSWSSHWARSPGRGRKLQCLLPLTKDCSGSQKSSRERLPR